MSTWGFRYQATFISRNGADYSNLVLRADMTMIGVKFKRIRAQAGLLVDCI